MFIESRDPVVVRALSIAAVQSVVDDIADSTYHVVNALCAIVIHATPRALGTTGSAGNHLHRALT